MSFPTPSSLGLPAQFLSWRPHQPAAILAITDGDRRFHGNVLPVGAGKTLTVAGAPLMMGWRTAFLTSTKMLQEQYCVSPLTKILTGDLRWRMAGQLKVGDRLLAFDEERAKNRRRWKPSLVESCRRITASCSRITLEDGTSVICTNDHKWLIKSNGNGPEWCRTDRLRFGGQCVSRILKLLDVWPTDHDEDAGYLRAAWDGEGSLHQSEKGNGADVQLSFAQKPNPMLVAVIGALERKGFSFSIGVSDPCTTLQISGRHAAIRFLGQIRPHRLLPKLNLACLGMIGPVQRLAVVSVEPLGMREVIALQTSSRTYVAEGLASHNCRDLSPTGLVDIRGQASYRCVAFDDEHRAYRERPWQGCDEGPCRVGHPCSRRPLPEEPRDILKGCESYDALAGAYRSRLVTTNYKLWLHAWENGRGLGPFDCLVLDEAHHADKELADFLSTSLEPADFQVLGGNAGDVGIAQWAVWAKRYIGPLKTALESRPRSKSEFRKYRHLKRLVTKLDTLSTMQDGEWVAQAQHGSWHFDPIFVARYADKLFRNIPHVILTSATITKKTTAMLGIADDTLTWHEAPSDFPVARRPVYYVPCVKLDYNSDPSQVRMWLATVDNFLRKRRDRKGIIHAVSYARAKQIREYSEFADSMILHDRHDTRDQVQRFKDAGPGAILVSPSVTTGYDFPYCVLPETKVLRANLKWSTADQLKAGDHLAGFDEHPGGVHRARAWRETHVVTAGRVKRPCYWLRFSDGTQVGCSAEHQWLVRTGGAHRWLTTENLRADAGAYSSKVAKLLPTWNIREDRDAGYLAAAFDGEGHLYQEVQRSRERGRLVTLAMSQNPNVMLTEVERLLTSASIRYRIYSKGGERCLRLQIMNRADVLRFLGEMRPLRLLPKLDWDLLGEIRTSPVTLIEKTFIGLRETIALSTTSKTFIAEGLASHNSQCEFQVLAKIPFPDRRSPVVAARTAHDPTYPAQIAAQEIMQAVGRGMRAADDQCETAIFDTNASWFMRVHQNLFLAWFLAAYQRVETMPDPPPPLPARA